MNKKGFTLVELLAVIIILFALIMLVLPNFVGSINNYSKKTDALTIDMIEKATKLYISDNPNTFDDESNNYYCISVKELVENNYLKAGIELSGKDITNNKQIEIDIHENNIELVDECEENKVICSAVTEENKTNGNIPSGEYNAGDEYI